MDHVYHFETFTNRFTENHTMMVLVNLLFLAIEIVFTSQSSDQSNFLLN